MRVKQRGDLGGGGKVGVVFFRGEGNWKGGDNCVKYSGKCGLPISPRKEKNRGNFATFFFFFTCQEIAYRKWCHRGESAHVVLFCFSSECVCAWCQVECSACRKKKKHTHRRGVGFVWNWCRTRSAGPAIQNPIRRSTRMSYFARHFHPNILYCNLVDIAFFFFFTLEVEEGGGLEGASRPQDSLCFRRLWPTLQHPRAARDAARLAILD